MSILKIYHVLRCMNVVTCTEMSLHMWHVLSKSVFLLFFPTIYCHQICILIHNRKFSLQMPNWSLLCVEVYGQVWSCPWADRVQGVLGHLDIGFDLWVMLCGARSWDWWFLWVPGIFCDSVFWRLCKGECFLKSTVEVIWPDKKGFSKSLLQYLVYTVIKNTGCNQMKSATKWIQQNCADWEESFLLFYVSVSVYLSI